MIGAKVIDKAFPKRWGLVWSVKVTVYGTKYSIRWCDGCVEYGVYEDDLDYWEYAVS